MIRRLLAGLFVLLPCAAFAQTPPVLQAGQVIAFDIPDTGKMQSGTTTVPRPEANLAFEFRIDASTTSVTAAKARACTNVVSVPGSISLTCYVTPPTLAEGTHTIAIRVLPSPAETGVTPSAFSTPLSIAVLLVTSPGTPGNVRLTP